MESLSELMPSGGEPVAYEAEKFGSSPEVLKGGRRKSRGKKSRMSKMSKKSRKSKKGRKNRNTRGGNAKQMAMGNGSVSVLGGKSRYRKKRRGGTKIFGMNV